MVPIGARGMVDISRSFDSPGACLELEEGDESGIPNVDAAGVFTMLGRAFGGGRDEDDDGEDDDDEAREAADSQRDLALSSTGHLSGPLGPTGG